MGYEFLQGQDQALLILETPARISESETNQAL